MNDYVTTNLDKGVVCPCCGQFAKRYRRSIHAQMAAWLICLVRVWEREQDWVDVKTLPARGGDYGKLVLWGLARLRPNPNDPSKRTSGLWLPTTTGVEFAHRRLRISKYVYVYNGAVDTRAGAGGFDDPLIDVVEALGERFDYEELMNA